MRTIMLLSFVLTQQSTIPKELLAARQNRNFATKGLVSWSIASKQGIVHCTTRFAGDEWINRNSYPGIDGAVSTQLYKDGEYWVTTGDSSAFCNIRNSPRPGIFDARTIGFSPMGMSETLDYTTSDPLSLSNGDPNSPGAIRKKTYAVSDDGPYRLITTQVVIRNGESFTVKQWLDPDKDFNVVKSQMFSKGDLKFESITLLQEDGQGHWFPSSTNVYQENRNEPVLTISVDETVFDEESLPDSFSPEDIGVEIGTNIFKEGVPNGPNDHANMHGMFSWDGESLVWFEEMKDRVNSGELELGPNVARIISRSESKDLVRKKFNQKVKETYENSKIHRHRKGLKALNSFFYSWERYVLQFIKFYGLNADQQSKAMSIYQSVRQVGDNYLRRKQPDFEKLNKRINALLSLSETKNKQKVVNELADERLRLEKPIIELFNKQLKPRLTSLLTRKQKVRGGMK